MKKTFILSIILNAAISLASLAQHTDSSRIKLFRSSKADIENLLKKAEPNIDLEVEIASRQKQAIEEAPSII